MLLLDKILTYATFVWLLMALILYLSTFDTLLATQLSDKDINWLSNQVNIVRCRGKKTKPKIIGKYFRQNLRFIIIKFNIFRSIKSTAWFCVQKKINTFSPLNSNNKNIVPHWMQTISDNGNKSIDWNEKWHRPQEPIKYVCWRNTINKSEHTDLMCCIYKFNGISVIP